MRNLKRALSLALASVMVLSMMVIGAGAASYDDFSDKDEIVNKEAVNVLVELGVIEGKDTGAFDPTGIITRGEMAKIICVVLNKGQDPNLGTVTSNTYTDTVGHWAAPYIEYCTSLGIVAGKGDGTFDPNATVTASESAKMLLVALGYSAEYEKMIGATWAVTTNVLANKNGLYDGLDIIVDAGLTRDNAAQMMYNALDAKVVQYDWAIVPVDGQLTSVATAKPYEDNRTLLTDKFGAVKVEGVVVANEYADLTGTGSKKAEKTEIVVTNHDENGIYADTNKTFTVSTGLDLLGKSVSLYVKPYNASESNSEKATVLGSVILSDSNVVVTDYSADSVATVAKDNDLKDNSYTTAYNYGANTTITVGQGVEKILIDNDGDGDLDYAIINRYDLGKVTKYSTKDDGAIVVRTDASSDEYEAADVIGFDDVAKDDFVLTAVIGGKLYVEKAETVTGVLDAYKQNKDKTLTTSLTVDGTAYKTANTVKVHADLTAAAGYGASYLGNEATFYLNKQGYIMAAGEVEESAYSYAFVIAKDKATNNIDDSRVKVALSDGTTGTYAFSDKGGITSIDSVSTGEVYRYSITSDNKIKLTDDATKAATNANGSFEKGKAAVTVDSSVAAYASNNTLFFYTDAVGKSVDVYTGFSKAPSTSVNGGNMSVYKDGDRVVAVVVVGGTAALTADDHLFVYGVGSNWDGYTVADVVLSGATDVSEGVKISEDGDAPVANTLYQYTLNSDNEYVLDKITAADSFYSTGSVTEKYENSFVLSGGLNGGELGLTNNTVVVDNTGSDPVVGDKSTFSKGDYVYAVVDGDDDAMMVVIMANDSDVYTVDMTKASSATIKVDGESVSVDSNNKFKAAAGATVEISGLSNSTAYYITEDLQVSSDGSGKLTFTMPAGDVTFGKAYSVTLDSGEAIWFVEGANVTADDVKANADKVWNGSAAVATTGNVITGIAADTTLTSMYKVTVTGNGTDKVGATKADPTEITTDGYVAVGETVTITADSGREAKENGTTGVTIIDGAYEFEMPAKNVTVKFDVQ